MKELLNKLKNNDVLLEIVNGELKVFAKAPPVSPSLLNEIRKNKDQLLLFLSGNVQAGSRSPGMHIPAAPEQAHYPLSSSQRRLWVLSQFEDGNTAYTMPGAYVFDGTPDIAALQYAFRALIERHESLRTIFKKDENGEPRQYILLPEGSLFNLTVRDLRSIEQREGQLKEWVAQQLDEPFNLSAGPLLRAALCQVTHHKWIFIYSLHHIISDSWSMGILIDELFLLYNAGTRGEKAPLPPLRIQCKDYAVWQQEQLGEESCKLHKSYWLKEMEGELPVLELPADRLHPVIRTYAGDVVRKKIDKGLIQGLRSVYQEEGSTLFMSLLAVVNAFLYRYTGQEDIIIGCPIAGREHPDLHNQIGFYSNTLPVRTRFKGSDSYRMLLANVKKTILNDYEHQAYPFDELVDALHPGPATGRHPLFDVLIELRNQPVGKNDPSAGLTDIRISPFTDRVHNVSKFDLTFFFTESDNELDLVIEYNIDIFDKETILEVGAHLEGLLEAIVKKPDTEISRLDYISAGERNKLLFEFNDTQIRYPVDKTVIDMFEAQAAGTPDKIAIIFEGTVISYRELNELSNRLANHLRSGFGIGPDDLVGIMLDRSEKMIISILGILKSGGAYLPIDPDLPGDRKAFILNDTRVKALITQMEYTYDLQYRNDAVLVIDIELDMMDTPIELTGSAAKPGNLAYVIYTSGSTGMPKGCMLTHANLYNYIQWANNYYFSETDESNFGLYTSLAFDLTVTSIFCSLTRGGQLTVYGRHKDLPGVLKDSFSAGSGINSIKLTPSFISVLEQLGIGPSAISRVIIGGEEVTPHHIKILMDIDPSIEIYNEYGPTETTVGCMAARLQEFLPVVIGRPVANTQIYILDKNGSLCPAGTPGEICIGGAGVARGYLNNDDLTNEKFIVNPFREGQRIYRTGDWGKWQTDGNALFLGRKDDQVKIRGYRIELGEIAAVLLRHPSVKDAIVLTKKDAEGNNDMIVYFVPAGTAIDKNLFNDLRNELTEWLKKHLPAYMIPRHFVQLEGMPLTTNGKVDKRALLTLEDPAGEMTTSYIAPENEIEEQLVVIWQEILNNERIGVKDDFFDLGGNSIKAMRLLARINKEFDIELSIEKLFNNPTIADVAHEIEKTNWANTGIMEAGNAEKFSI